MDIASIVFGWIKMSSPGAVTALALAIVRCIFKAWLIYLTSAVRAVGRVTPAVFFAFPAGQYHRKASMYTR